MKRITLDCRHMQNREELHDYLTKKLNLPEYYGRNLDALFDCLTDISEPTNIIIKNRRVLDGSLGQYADILFTVFSNAQSENDNIILTMKEN